MPIKWGGGTSTWSAPAYRPLSPVVISKPVLQPTRPVAPQVLTRPVFTYDAAPPARSFGLTPDAPGVDSGPNIWLLAIIGLALYMVVSK